jgi:hypothetical protein
LRILAHVNHFFGKNPNFSGKSTVRKNAGELESEDNIALRTEYIEKTIASLKNLGSVDVKICGLSGQSIVPLDLDFSGKVDDPTQLMYATLQLAGDKISEYDYLINIEDDIVFPSATFERIVTFDSDSFTNEVLHPNRMEISHSGKEYCVDLKAIPSWTYNQRMIFGHVFRQAVNPHSALAVFRKDKLKYALQHSDIKSRSIKLYKGMDSAYASIHSPFLLWRCFSNHSFHAVYHQDRWKEPTEDFFAWLNWKKFFFPTVALRLKRHFTRHRAD